LEVEQSRLKCILAKLEELQQEEGGSPNDVDTFDETGEGVITVSEKSFLHPAPPDLYIHNLPLLTTIESSLPDYINDVNNYHYKFPPSQVRRLASVPDGKTVYEKAAPAANDHDDDVPDDDSNLQLSIMTLRRANVQLQKRCQVLEKR